MKYFFVSCCIAAAVSGGLIAQETPRFAFSGGAGFSMPVGNTGRNLDTGWNVRAGAGINFSSYLGAMLNVGYDSMGIQSGVLNNLGYGGGNLNVFSATIDPIVHLKPKSSVDVYVTGGGGLFHQNQQFTQPSVSLVGGFNPFFGFYQVPVATNVVVAQYSLNKPGIDVGAGVAFGKKWGGKFFAEARYNRIFTGNYHTDYLPITFGFRR